MKVRTDNIGEHELDMHDALTDYHVPITKNSKFSSFHLIQNQNHMPLLKRASFAQHQQWSGS